MENNQPLVPRNMYTQAVVRELNAIPYDPVHHNGRHNPYSQKAIECKEDYEEYVREYVYYRLCDQTLKEQYMHQLTLQAKQSGEYRRNEFQKLKVQHKDEINKLKALHNKELTRQKQHWPFRILVFSFVLVFALMVIWYIPAKQRDGYNQGYVLGYAEASGFNTKRITEPKDGMDIHQIVFVSNSGHLIHRNQRCSNLMYYTCMPYGVACANGYRHCSKC